MPLMPTKKKAKPKAPDNVVSALVFNESKAPGSASGESAPVEKPKQPITASVFVANESDLMFKTKIRNIIEFSFGYIREQISNPSPATGLLDRGVEQMKSMADEVGGRLGAATAKHYNELTDEIAGFIRSGTIGQDEKNDRRYRCYVRIAWLSHSILEDLRNSNQ
jgi:hypothetical protein